MKDRLLTAIVLILISVASATATHPLPFFVLCALLAGLSYRELRRLAGISSSAFPWAATAAFVFYAVCYFGYKNPLFFFVQFLALGLFGALCSALLVKRPSRLLLEAGSLWVATPLIALVYLHGFADPSVWFSFTSPLFVTVIPIWLGDTLAYLVGKRFGRHLLAPSLSPKKTWEGAMANLAGCLIGAAFIGWLTSVPIPVALGCGLIAGTLGQVGDLFESALKRQAGVKDTGGLLPGHGGVMDRLDSVYMSVPAQAVLLAVALNLQR